MVRAIGDVRGTLERLEPALQRTLELARAAADARDEFANALLSQRAVGPDKSSSLSPILSDLGFLVGPHTEIRLALPMLTARTVERNR